MDKIKRGRPTLLRDEIKTAIATYRDKHPDWSARQILDKIHRDLYCLWKEKQPKWDDSQIEAKIILPGLNRVQRYINEITSRMDKPSPLEAPWHLGTLVDYPLPPEALPLIKLIQDYAKMYPDPTLKTPPPQESVTIRQSQWVARLSGFYRDLKKRDAKKNLEAAVWLYRWSKVYATHQRICELAGTSLDTSVLDESFPYDYPEVRGNQWLLMHRDGSFTLDSETAKQISVKDGGA